MAQDKKKCSQCGKTLSFLSKFIVLSFENEDMLCLKCSLKCGQKFLKDRRKENNLKDISYESQKGEIDKPEIENTELEKAEIEKIIIDSGLFKADVPNWIQEIILSNIDKGSKFIALAIRKHGEPLSAEEKRKHRIRGNAKVSNQYLLSLTDEGKKDPIRAAFIVVQRILHKWSIRRAEPAALSTGLEWESELCCAHDDRTCKAALELDGTRFPMDETPDLPLPDCDAEYCRCLFLYHIKR